MRWITILVLWIAAMILAIVILRRVRRGKPVVLSGRWSPRIVRMVVVVLVVLGVGEQSQTPEAAAAPLKLPIRSQDDQLPASFKPYMVQAWLMIHQEGGQYQRGRAELLLGMAGKPLDAKQTLSAKQYAESLRGQIQILLLRDLDAAQNQKPVPETKGNELKLALDELETNGRYNHYLCAYLWRKSEQAEFVDSTERIELYARFRQHVRITDALIRAHGQVKPLMQSPRAWMSKGGPRGRDIEIINAYQASIADMIKTADAAMPTTDDGTWKRDGIVLVKPGDPSPLLIRAGRERAILKDEATRFGRLDLLKTGEKAATIDLVGLGEVSLPAHSLTSVWELPNLLPKELSQKLDQLVLDALKNNSEDAAENLERCLGVAHTAIRTGLREMPKAKGAPRLRLILALFEDSPMPELRNYRASEQLEGSANRLGRPSR